MMETFTGFQKLNNLKFSSSHKSSITLEWSYVSTFDKIVKFDLSASDGDSDSLSYSLYIGNNPNNLTLVSVDSSGKISFSVSIITDFSLESSCR